MKITKIKELIKFLDEWSGELEVWDEEFSDALEDECGLVILESQQYQDLVGGQR